MKIITSVILIAMLLHCSQAWSYRCPNENCTQPWPNNVTRQLRAHSRTLWVIEDRVQPLLRSILEAQHQYLQPKALHLAYRYVMNVSTSWKQGCKGFADTMGVIEDSFINCANKIFPAVEKYHADLEKWKKRCDYLYQNITIMTQHCHWNGNEQGNCGITLEDVKPSLDELNESVAALENSTLSDPARSREFLNSIQCRTDEVFTYPREISASHFDIMDLCKDELRNRTRQSTVRLAKPEYEYLLKL